MKWRTGQDCRIGDVAGDPALPITVTGLGEERVIVKSAIAREWAAEPGNYDLLRRAAASTVTVRDIIRGYLIAHDYDGLFNDLVECGCRRDDLFPCDSPCDGCQIGYLQPPGEETGETWTIGPEKPGLESSKPNT